MNSLLIFRIEEIEKTVIKTFTLSDIYGHKWDFNRRRNALVNLQWPAFSRLFNALSTNISRTHIHIFKSFHCVRCVLHLYRRHAFAEQTITTTTKYKNLSCQQQDTAEALSCIISYFLVLGDVDALLMKILLLTTRLFNIPSTSSWSVTFTFWLLPLVLALRIQFYCNYRVLFTLILFAKRFWSVITSSQILIIKLFRAIFIKWLSNINRKSIVDFVHVCSTHTHTECT